MLAEILAKKTLLPVAEVKDGMAVEPDHVYVIPPNTSLVLTSSVLRLMGREAAPARHTPIDTLFHSIAKERGHNAIGVILSGSGSDGARGLAAVKAEGGITFAQELTSARFAHMPRSAIDTGCVDFILSPAAIAEALVRMGRHPYLNGSAAETTTTPSDEDHLKRIFRLLRSASGLDFTQYKRSMIMRRLGRRMALHQIDEIGPMPTWCRTTTARDRCFPRTC
ncbi:MAG: chemotaxis protein CheB [Chromatiales bacterium]